MAPSIHSPGNCCVSLRSLLVGFHFRVSIGMPLFVPRSFAMQVVLVSTSFCSLACSALSLLFGFYFVCTSERQPQNLRPSFYPSLSTSHGPSSFLFSSSIDADSCSSFFVLLYGLALFHWLFSSFCSPSLSLSHALVVILLSLCLSRTEPFPEKCPILVSLLYTSVFFSGRWGQGNRKLVKNKKIDFLWLLGLESGSDYIGQINRVQNCSEHLQLVVVRHLAVALLRCLE